jgi:hypothetical protein
MVLRVASYSSPSGTGVQDLSRIKRAVSLRFKPKFRFKPKDHEERTIAVSDTLLDCLKKHRPNAPNDGLIYASAT